MTPCWYKVGHGSNEHRQCQQRAPNESARHVSEFLVVTAVCEVGKSGIQLQRHTALGTDTGLI